MPPHLAKFVFLVATGFLHVGQAGLEFPTSGDVPDSSSHSVGIIGVSHCTSPYPLIFFFLLKWSFVLITQAGVQWRDLAHRNLHLLGSGNSPASASRVVGTTGVHHHTQLIFCIFNRDRVSPC